VGEKLLRGVEVLLLLLVCQPERHCGRKEAFLGMIKELAFSLYYKARARRE